MALLDEIPTRYANRQELEKTATAIFSEYSRILGFKNLKTALSEKLKPEALEIEHQQIRPFCTATHDCCEVIMEVGFLHEPDPKRIQRWEYLQQHLAQSDKGYLILVAPRDMMNMMHQHVDRLKKAPNVLTIITQPAELKDAVYKVYYKMILGGKEC